MKLNSEQLTIIDSILENHDLDFLDFKLEIKDHIASQIEDLCKEESLSFESALSITIEQWKPHLRLKESLWISNKRSFPRIVTIGLRKRYIIYNCISIVLWVFLYMIDIYKLRELQLNPIYVVGSFGALWLIFSYFRYSIYKSGMKTSFSYEFNRYYILFCLMFGFGVLFLLLDGNSSIIIWGFVILAYMPTGLYSYFKHKQFEKRYQFV